MPLSTKYKLEE